MTFSANIKDKLKLFGCYMKKFTDKYTTAKGETRAWVNLKSLKTLWFNTGTLCNLSCENCYIESSPKNDSLAYLTLDDVTLYLDEIKQENFPVDLIGLTGGEPFLNPNIISILESILAAGHDALVLTNAHKVLKRQKPALLALKDNYGEKLHLRVSLDHYTEAEHELQRGKGTFDSTLESMQWLFENGFNLSIAGRSLKQENPQLVLTGYQNLLLAKEINLPLKLNENIVIFPEMIQDENVPEITTDCWGILNKSPDDQMCASERMIVKRKGDASPVVLACTLLAYDPEFEVGSTLKEAHQSVYLNHTFCAKFCVLGGASCSSAK